MPAHDSDTTRPAPWLSGLRRELASLTAALAVALVLTVAGDLSASDIVLLALLGYLLVFLIVTATAFSRATPDQIRDWALRDNRGSVVERYVLGTAPGPGVSLFISAVAMLVAILWIPEHKGETLLGVPAVAVGLLLIVIAWLAVVFSFAVTFHADDLVEGQAGLDFPGSSADEVGWSDYIYFALSVMVTFGTTDVSVTSREMRRTVVANAVIAFVFNTVTVAIAVSAVG